MESDNTSQIRDLSGTVIKGYALRQLIGVGGTGAVYRAYQPVIEREVAVKAILPRYANHLDFIRRFDVEAQLVARLEHPFIVPLYDYWREPGEACLVTRYLRGGSLKSAIEGHSLTLDDIDRVVDQITHALAFAHQNGIVHSDLKPGNILLDEAKNAYLADFGIARGLGQGHLSDEGNLVGSPAYLAPEQILKQDLTPQTDIYSLGIILYELLTGEHPFPNADSNALLLLHLQTPLPSLLTCRPDLPVALDHVIEQATCKVPDGRFLDALSLAAAFHEVITHPDNPVVMHDIQLTFGSPELRNPYKGLRAFQEADAGDFFGREALVQQLLQGLRQTGGVQFLALVGPSGSGKSSVVRAGLIPALRQNAIPGSSRWFLAEMLPGKMPLQELATALLRIAVTRHEQLLRRLEEDERGLLEVIEQILPDNDTELILFIDQFEEVFTLVDEEKARVHFLNSLRIAVTAPLSRLHVVVTLRADFYDRPLLYPEFGSLLRTHAEVILPMTPEQLEEAIVGPAERVGLKLERGLAAQIISDVREQPGTLPLLQHTLAELYAHRQENVLTLEAYHNIGGVLGSLARRAEEIFQGLNAREQKATHQLFLRLVTLGEGTEDTRRRVPRAELLSIGIENRLLETILDTFGKYRLLTFDHDPATRDPTVEIAHEALIKTWERLRLWIETSREDLRLHRRLTNAATEWLTSGQDKSFLATGVRLEQFEAWATTAPLMLNKQEKTYLQSSIAERQKQYTLEAERAAREIELERRSQNRLRALLGLMGIAVIVAFILTGWALDERQTARQNAANAATGEAQARRSADETHSLALAAAARQALRDNNPDLAIVLALEANRMPLPPPQAHQVLAEVVYSTGTRTRRPFPNFESSTSIAVGADGLTALIGYTDRALRYWNMETGQLIREFYGHDALIYGLAYSPGWRRAIAGTGSGSLFVWDLATGTLVRRLEGHKDPVTVVLYHPNSRLVASATRRGELIVWNVETGQQVAIFEGHNGSAIIRLAFSANGNWLASASVDDTACIWDIETGLKLRCVNGAQGDVRAVAFSPDGSKLVTGGADYSLVLWDISTGEETRRFIGHTGMVNDAQFSSDGATIISGADDNIVIVWEVDSGEEVRRFLGHSSPVKQVSFLRSDERSALSVSAEDLRIWDIESGAQLRRITGHESEVTSVAFSPDGTTAVSGSRDRTLILWNLATGERIREFAGHTDWVTSVAFSPDGKTIVSGSLDRDVIVWDVESGSSLYHLRGHTGSVTSVAYSADGATILSGSADGSVRLWDTKARREVRRLLGHTAQISSVTFSPDNTQIVSASFDGTLRLWDAETGDLLKTFIISNNNRVFSVAFSPDGSKILSGSTTSEESEGILRLWDIASGREIRRFIGHSGDVTSVAFSPTGLTALSASSDRSIRLWDISTGDEIARFAGHTDTVTSVTFSADGRTALSASRDRSLRLWRTFRSLAELMDYAYTNRYVRGLTCEEREKYLVTPLCPGNITIPATIISPTSSPVFPVLPG